MTDNNENVKQRARRLAKEFEKSFPGACETKDRKWMRYAFARGYQAAAENLVDDIDQLGLDIIEINDVLDFYDTREAVTA